MCRDAATIAAAFERAVDGLRVFTCHPGVRVPGGPGTANPMVADFSSHVIPFPAGELSKMGELIIRRDGPVGRVVFSNPAKYNAMSYDMWMALPRALKDFDADPSIRLVVLEGDGNKAFVSGADISQFESRRSDADGQASYNRAVEMAYLSPIECSKPVIAKIRGICMGGGLGLAAACDLRFCSDDSRFRMPAARLGLGYNSVGVRRFLDVFGLQNTLDIFYTARIFGAADALKMGFASRVEKPEALDAVVDEWCAMVAANAPLTLKALKLTVNELGRDAGERDMAAVNAALARCYASDDYREGAAAFMEKRPPMFRGA